MTSKKKASKTKRIPEMKTATTNESRNKKLIRRLKNKIKSPTDTCKNKYEEGRRYVPKPDKQFK